MSIQRPSLAWPGHSGMLHSRNPADGQNEFAPSVALRGEHVGADRGETVIAPPALSRLLNPAAQNPPAFLEAVHQRGERRDAEFQKAPLSPSHPPPHALTLPP